MKKIEDYLHLYIGCEVAAPNPYDDHGVEIAKGVLTGLHGEYGPEIQFIIDGNAEEHPEYVQFIKVKPILRRLSSMTEEETAHWNKLKRYNPVNGKVEMFQEHNEEQFLWLLSKGFDLFGLIDAGLAIDAAIL
jgi:hypothetical protein